MHLFHKALLSSYNSYPLQAAHSTPLLLLPVLSLLLHDSLLMSQLVPQQPQKCFIDVILLWLLGVRIGSNLQRCQQLLHFLWLNKEILLLQRIKIPSRGRGITYIPLTLTTLQFQLFFISFVLLCFIFFCLVARFLSITEY